ncbi:MAG: hypothetical protein JKY56_05155 [Kofleriaceae bacterium]|nr:hypothetical protein [Kofleriaceae bacterium]
MSIGATVNIYVANPDKRPDEEQHTYASLFNLKHVVNDSVSIGYDVGTLLFSAYRIIEGCSQGVANHVNLINLPRVLAHHDDLVADTLVRPTTGWKTGILKFLDGMGEWWPSGAWNEEILQRLFTVVDATKFYLAATRQGLVCDMKVAPTPFFWNYEENIRTQFISYQRGNAAATGFENQLSGSMCEGTDLRLIYATKGANFGDGFGSKTVVQNARAFEKITAIHGVGMQQLAKKRLGVDSTKLGGRRVADPDPGGWSGPVCVFKHPKDQSWLGRTLSESEKSRAKRDINAMASDALKMCSRETALHRLLQPDLLKVMKELPKLSFFNIYA